MKTDFDGAVSDGRIVLNAKNSRRVEKIEQNEIQTPATKKIRSLRNGKIVGSRTITFAF
jgi:dihydrodipicolinate reductase